MRIVAPFATEDVIVENSVTVAETVLIGEVPEFYTNMSGNNSRVENE